MAREPDPPDPDLPPRLRAELRHRDGRPLRLQPLQRARLSAATARHFDVESGPPNRVWRITRRRGWAAAAALALCGLTGWWLQAPGSAADDLNADGRIDIVDAMLLARAGEHGRAEALARAVVRLTPHGGGGS